MINQNIASHLIAMATANPERYAVVIQNPRTVQSFNEAKLYQHSYTYQQLNAMSDLIACGLKTYGIGKATRTVLMVKPSLDFFALVFALFKLEAVLVAIDPGIGIKNLTQCLHDVAPQAFIGNTQAHIARILFAWAKSSITKTVLVGGQGFGSTINLKHIKAHAKGRKFNGASTQASDTAAILFTSGSTGAPKGVVYTHANFTAQINGLKQLYHIQPGEIDLATFPLFALFAPALGMTSIVPDMDFTRPGSVNPKKIIAAIRQYRCSTMFGSPALLKRVSDFGVRNQIKLPTLKRVLSAGAPVTPETLANMNQLLPDDGTLFSAYGATESLPVSSIDSHYLLTNTISLTAKGKGICIGKPTAQVTVKIINISDDIIPKWEDKLMLPEHSIGEICVSGAVVTAAYYHRKTATQLAKIYTPSGFYHRLGDLGYFDAAGRLWLCGRRTQRVITDTATLFTTCCEEIFNQHPAVYRTALVGVQYHGNRLPVICVELNYKKDWFNKTKIRRELFSLSNQHATTQAITIILFHRKFPVDVRHNAKINREQLAQWAASKLT